MPSLEELYRSHLDMVFRICSRYTKDRDEAEDLTQETFVLIDRNLARFRGDSRPSTWIYRIATNCCLDHLRKCKSQSRLNADYLDSMVLRNLSPEGDRVLAKIDLDRILAHLRPGVRQILFLSLAEGLSYREVGEITGFSREAVAKTVVRFLKKKPSGGDPSGRETTRTDRLSLIGARRTSKGIAMHMQAPGTEVPGTHRKPPPGDLP